MSSPIRNLDELYPVLNQRRFTAGWHKARPSLWREPITPFVPLHWQYAEAAGHLDLAGDWIGTDLAERRNLLMFNPVGDNDYASLPSLVAAYQMIKPGEAARAHRHSPNALRLILDAGDAVTTVVDGVELPMVNGDVLLTPGWTWHSHFNHGRDNAYWIDVLDVPLVHRLESMFFEPHPQEHQAVTQRPAQSTWRFTLADQTALLDVAAETEAGHRWADLVAPDLRTMRLRVHHLNAGGSTLTDRAAENRILAVIDGEGEARIGDTRFSWRRGDVLVVPIWHWQQVSASTDSRWLEVSDYPVQHLLGLHRQEHRQG